MKGTASNVHNLNDLLSSAGLRPLDSDVLEKFETYLALILRWNARTNLTSLRAPAEICSRHFVESIACAQHLPAGIASLLDFGSGAGFPGIPIALCRPEISVTLAESQVKKAAFLREAIRTLSLNVTVWAGRAEGLSQKFDCVTLRAVDRMDRAVPAASALLGPEGWLAILTSSLRLESVQSSAGPGSTWVFPIPLPGSDQRILALAQNAR